MQWLRSFAALALLCGIVTTLLPEGGMRKTAALVIGLILTLSWVDSLQALPIWPALPNAPDTALTAAADVPSSMPDYAAQLSAALSTRFETDVRVELNADGTVGQIILPESADSSVLRQCRAALGLGADANATGETGR